MPISSLNKKIAGFFVALALIPAAIAGCLKAFTDVLDSYENFQQAVNSLFSIEEIVEEHQPVSVDPSPLVVPPKELTKPAKPKYLDDYVEVTLRAEEDFFIDVRTSIKSDLDIDSLTGIQSRQPWRGWLGSAHRQTCYQTTPPRDSIEKTVRCKNLYQESNYNDKFYFYTLVRVSDDDNRSAPCLLYNLDLKEGVIEKIGPGRFMELVSETAVMTLNFEYLEESLNDLDKDRYFIDYADFEERTAKFGSKWKEDDACSVWLKQFEPEL